MRVLHVYRTYYPDSPGGLQEAIRQIATSTESRNISSLIFALSPSPKPSVIYAEEGWVIRARSWVAPVSCDLGGVGAFRTFSKAASLADVIHYHFPWPFADIMHLLVRPRAPAIITYHSDIVRQRWLSNLYAPLMRNMFASMAAIVATSPVYAKTSSVLSDKKYLDRLRVIPLGVAEDTFPTFNQKAVLQFENIPESAPFFLFIGVLRYYKGLHTLIEAASITRAHLVIAGDGPEMNSLQQRVRRHKLKNVVFVGAVSDVEKANLLNRCQALVLPSHLRSEAYGMVLVEASMFGKPMVSCEIGTGTSFVNLHNVTGFVVPPESPKALAQAMNALIEDKTLAEKFGRAARRRYEELFSGPALGKAYAQLYQDVLEKSK